MSIVKWSTVRIKTKDKLIITGLIEEMKSDYFSEIGFGICRHDCMFI